MSLEISTLVTETKVPKPGVFDITLHNIADFLAEKTVQSLYAISHLANSLAGFFISEELQKSPT